MFAARKWMCSFLLTVTVLTATLASASDILKAAEHGDAEAQAEMGDINFSADHNDSHNVIALQWYKKSADQGFAKGQFIIRKPMAII